MQRHRSVDFDESKSKAIPNESLLKPISASITESPSLTKSAALRGSMKAGEGIGEAAATATAAEVFEEATDFHKIRNVAKKNILDSIYFIKYKKSKYLYNIDEGNNSNNNMQNKILRARYKCGVIVKHRHTQKLIILLLLIYAILLGVATYPIVRNNLKTTSIFNKVEITILIIFTLELLMQLVYRGYKQFIKKGNLIFDFVMILLSWIVTPIPSLCRTLRILQTFRLVGRLNSLREVVKALVNGFQMLAAIIFLLLVIFYIFSVLFTSIYKNMYDLGQTKINYFGNLGKSAFTLFQIMCLDNWSEIAREVMKTYQFAWIPFMTFVILASFIVLDSAIGVFCTGLDEIKGVSLMQNSDDNVNNNDNIVEEGENSDDNINNNDNIVEEGDYDDLLYELDATQELITNISTLQQKSLRTLNSFLLPKFNIDIYDMKSRETNNNNINNNNNNNRDHGKYEASWNHLRHTCEIINNNKIYQSFMISLIILNAVWSGLNTYKVLRSNEQFATVFNYLNTSFLTFFTIEIIIKLLSYGIKTCFKDYWFIIDFFVTFMSWGLEVLQILRSLKIIRFVTIISRIQSLRDVVTALQSCLPKLITLFLLLLCIFYIFSVLFTSMYKDMYKLGQTEIDYFGSLPKTAFTLFQIICLDNWSEIAREVMKTYHFAWGHFMSFIILTAFLIIKMMISLLCGAVSAVRQQEYYDFLEQNNLDFYGGGCSTSDNIHIKVDELAGIVDGLQNSHKNMNEYIQSLSKYLSSLSLSDIKTQQKPRSKNSICSSIKEHSFSFISETDYEIFPNVDNNINESDGYIWESNNFSTTLEDSFGNFDEAYCRMFGNKNDNYYCSLDSEQKYNDSIGIIVNASYAILNADNDQVSNNYNILSHDIGVITEETCKESNHDTSTTDYDESIRFTTDANVRQNR